MDELFTRFDNIFFEKTRLSMLTIIYQEDVISFNALKKRIGGSDGAIYTHLEKLVKGGYVAKRKELAGDGVQTVYFITPEGKKAILEYLSFMEKMIQQTIKGE